MIPCEKTYYIAKVNKNLNSYNTKFLVCSQCLSEICPVSKALMVFKHSSHVFDVGTCKTRLNPCSSSFIKCYEILFARNLIKAFLILSLVKVKKNSKTSKHFRFTNRKLKTVHMITLRYDFISCALFSLAWSGELCNLPWSNLYYVGAELLCDQRKREFGSIRGVGG